MTQANGKPTKLGIVLAFAAVYLIWGSTYLAIRFAIETIPPFLMAGVRFLIAGGILYVIMRLRGVQSPLRIHWRSALIVGALMLVGGNGFVTFAEQSVPSSLAALMVTTVPMWLVVINWVRPDGQKPGLQVIGGLVLGLLGTVILIGPGTLADGTRIEPIGLAAMIAAPILWAGGSLYTRHATLPESPLMATAAEMLMGGVLLTLVGVVTGEPSRLVLSEVSSQSLLALAYLSIFGSIVAFSAYVWLIKVTTPAQAGTYAYVNPVIAVLLGWLVASEPLGVRTLVGGGVILVAVIIVNTYKSRPATQPLKQATARPRVASSETK